MPDSPHSPPQAADLPALPPDFTIDGITRNQWAAWRAHPVTKVFRKYLADMMADRIEAGKQAMLATALTHEGQVRIATEVALLDQMSDPRFEAVGFFYEKSRMTQEEWDAERQAREAQDEAGGEDQLNDPDAEEDDGDGY